MLSPRFAAGGEGTRVSEEAAPTWTSLSPAIVDDSLSVGVNSGSVFADCTLSSVFEGDNFFRTFTLFFQVAGWRRCSSKAVFLDFGEESIVADARRFRCSQSLRAPKSFSERGTGLLCPL